MRPPGTHLRPWIATLGFAVTAIDLYLVGLLVAAARRPPGESPAASDRPGNPSRFAVLVPAHDEEAQIAATLAALQCAAASSGRASIFVIADNCSDATAQIAARAGATVLERRDPARRGKGHALNWTLDRLNELDGEFDAIAIVDADCEASPNLLESFDARLRDGAHVVQASYTVANPGASTQSSLRFAAFALMNSVRPLGKDRLGLSCGLLGTGMAFRREVLERHRFAPGSLVEDTDLHLRLVMAGERVAFAPEASVSSPMPTTAQASRAQQSRWEGGRLDLLRAWNRPLLTAGLQRRDRVRLHAWLELLIPPQSLLALGHLVLGVLALGSRWRVARRVAALDVGLQTVFVLGGLHITRAPAVVYRALAGAPGLILQKLGIAGRLMVSGAPPTWERTQREEPS